MIKRSVPIDLIFSQDNVVREGDPHYRELSIWQDIPIIALEPCRSAVSAIMGRDGSLEGWIEFRRKNAGSERVDPSTIELEVRRAAAPWRRIFRRNLPVVRRLERDRLILADGNLPCCVAKLRGQAWIDVLMPEDVAAQWDARSTVELDRVVADQRRVGFYTPVMHEKYRNWKVSRPGVGRLDLMRIFLGPVHRRLSVLDIGCNTGFYDFHFDRQGFKATGIDFNPQHLAIAKALRSLYSSSVAFELCGLNEFKPGKKYDIVLALTVFWHMLGWGKMPASITPRQLGDKLDELVGHALFWESGRRAEEEIKIIKEYSGLRHYTRLGTTRATGKDREQSGAKRVGTRSQKF
jgi:hypothetical protein